MSQAAFIAASPAARSLRAPTASGCRLTDDEGGVRIDFHMGGGSVLLGHARPEVEAAAAERCARPEDAAAALCALLPANPKALFCAQESQALPAAVDAARRATGRRRAAVWEPSYGELDTDGLACVIVDPMGLEPADLRSVRKAADRCGALLIFDEGTTSFRVDARGAQGLSGVRPDLAVFGAAIANGRPIGAVAGCATLMAAIAPDDLPPPRADALAAAAATLGLLDRAPVAPQLRILGAEILAEVEVLIQASGAARLFSLAGDPTLPTPFFAAPALEGLWLRAMTEAGLSVLGPHALCATHGQREASALISAYAGFLPAVMARSLAEVLNRPRPLYDPLFSAAPEGRA